jgi:hypothetical protein
MEGSLAVKRASWKAAECGDGSFGPSKGDEVIDRTSIPKTKRDISSFAIGNRYVRTLKRKPWAPKKQVRMKCMAALSTTGFSEHAAPSRALTGHFARRPRRQITPQAGKALEKLGHAIEYLTDEFVQSGDSFSANNSQLEAVQLLMALNRRVYFECPEVPTLGEMLRSLLHRATN